jgi:hypothetical protein
MTPDRRLGRQAVDASAREAKRAQEELSLSLSQRIERADREARVRSQEVRRRRPCECIDIDYKSVSARQSHCAGHAGGAVRRLCHEDLGSMVRAQRTRLATGNRSPASAVRNLSQVP